MDKESTFLLSVMLGEDRLVKRLHKQQEKKKDISDKGETNVCKAIDEMIEKGVQRGIVQGKEAGKMEGKIEGKIEVIMQIKLNIPRIQLRVLTSAVVLCYNFIYIGKFCFVWNMPD